MEDIFTLTDILLCDNDELEITVGLDVALDHARKQLGAPIRGFVHVDMGIVVNEGEQIQQPDIFIA